MGVVQHRLSHDIGKQKGYKAGEQTEDEKTVGVLLHTFHVHLQSGKEHNIIESYASEQLERVVALQNVEAILSDDDTCQHHADDMRNTQFTHHDRRKQNNHQHHKED